MNQNLHNSKKYLYVCNALHTQGRDNARQRIAGFFYARILNKSGSVPPCDVLMDSLPLRCNATGKAEPFFFSSRNINFLQMHYTENECAAGTQEKTPITISSDNPENIRENLHGWFANLKSAANNLWFEIFKKN